MPLTTSEARGDAALRLLHQVLIRIRTASGEGDSKLAYELADSFEELPMKVVREEWDEIDRDFERIYLKSLFEEHSDLTAIRGEWLRLTRADAAR